MKSSRASKTEIMKTHNFSEEELAEYKEAFNIFDRDGSGAISNKELGIALRSLGLNPSDDELTRMIHEVDKDGNEELDFDEFCELMSKTKKDVTSYKAIEEAFKVFDKEGKAAFRGSTSGRS